jgi:tRNA(Arg) A34 adenosine deaminase TadA
MKSWVAEHAIKTAKNSHYPHFRHGAVTECGGRILTKKPNISKSRTPDASMSTHAEVAALKQLQSKARLLSIKRPVDLYVARVSPREEVVFSKPCDKCMAAMKASGIIRAVFYSTNDGDWIEVQI